MNVLDLIIGVILLIFAIAGLRKGLIIEAFYLASFIVGIYGAMFFSDAVAVWMSDFVKADGDIIAIIAFILTFIGVMVLVRFLGRMISNLVEAICLGLIDKIGGFIFGLFKGALIVSIFIMIMKDYSAALPTRSRVFCMRIFHCLSRNRDGMNRTSFTVFRSRTMTPI